MTLPGGGRTLSFEEANREAKAKRRQDGWPGWSRRLSRGGGSSKKQGFEGKKAFAAGGILLV
jgi:hypothetical protein